MIQRVGLPGSRGAAGCGAPVDALRVESWHNAQVGTAGGGASSATVAGSGQNGMVSSCGGLSSSVRARAR